MQIGVARELGQREAGQGGEGRSARGRHVMWVICSPHGSHCQTAFNSASITRRFRMWRLWVVQFLILNNRLFPSFSSCLTICRKPRLLRPLFNNGIVKDHSFHRDISPEIAAANLHQAQREVAARSQTEGAMFFIAVSFSGPEHGKSPSQCQASPPVAQTSECK